VSRANATRFGWSIKRILMLVATSVIATLVGGCAGGAGRAGGSTVKSGTDSTGVATEILVAAASDLRPAFTELATAFTASSGIKVNLTFGASGQLKRQIEDGSPVDFFAAADRALVEDLAAQGHAEKSTLYTYGFVDLSLATATGITVEKAADNDSSGAHPLDQLAEPKFRRIAIANPAFAPYGKAAQQAINATTQATVINQKLVLAENVADALRLVESGDVDAALVAKSLTIAAVPPLSSTITDLPSGLHEEIPQGAVVTAKTSESKSAASVFLSYLQSDRGRQIMKRYGFSP
jgi:molybdate transport system substrate-binding protein